MIQLNLFVHQQERTKDTTRFVQENAVRLGGNCAKVMQHFQKNNTPLTDDTARLWLDVRNLAQRVADLRLNGIVILDTWVKDSKYRNSHKKYELACTCLIPERDNSNCYLHNPTLKF